MNLVQTQSAGSKCSCRQILLEPKLIAVWLTLAALAARFFHLTQRGLWTDEIKTLRAAMMDWAPLALERMEDGHFPTYYWLVKAWVWIFGSAEWSLRAPSTLLGAAAAPLVYLTARRWWGNSAAIWSCVFYILHARAIWAGQEARPYAAVILAAIGSVHALMLAWESTPARRRWWIVYGLWTLLGLTMHATYAFLYIGQLLAVAGWLAWRRQWRWDWAFTVVGVGAVGGMAYGWLKSFQTNVEFYREAAWPELAVFREALIQIFWGDYDYLWGSGFKYLGLPLLALAIYLAVRAVSRRRLSMPASTHNADRLLLVLSLTLAFSPLVLLTLIQGLNSSLGGEGIRYYIVGLGGACWIFGAAAAGIVSNKWRIVYLAVILILMSSVTIGFYWRSEDQLREAIQLVAESAQPNEPVFLMRGADSQLIAEYYGLDREIVGIDDDWTDEARLELIIDRNATGAEGFWVIIYKPHDSPFGVVLKRWTETHGFNRQRRIQLEDAQVLYYLPDR